MCCGSLFQSLTALQLKLFLQVSSLGLLITTLWSSVRVSCSSTCLGTFNHMVFHSAMMAVISVISLTVYHPHFLISSTVLTFLLLFVAHLATLFSVAWILLMFLSFVPSHRAMAYCTLLRIKPFASITLLAVGICLDTNFSPPRVFLIPGSNAFSPCSRWLSQVRF